MRKNRCRRRVLMPGNLRSPQVLLRTTKPTRTRAPGQTLLYYSLQPLGLSLYPLETMPSWHWPSFRRYDPRLRGFRYEDMPYGSSPHLDLGGRQGSYHQGRPMRRDVMLDRPSRHSAPCGYDGVGDRGASYASSVKLQRFGSYGSRSWNPYRRSW